MGFPECFSQYLLNSSLNSFNCSPYKLPYSFEVRGPEVFRFCCRAFFACFEYQSLPGLFFNHRCLPAHTARG